MLKILELCGVFAIFFVLLGIIVHPNFALNEDLGRHLKLGEIIWQTKSVPATNFFTYTNSDFPFINHHWLSEIVFYFFNIAGGLFSLTVLKIGIMMIAVFFILKLALRHSNFLSMIISFTVLAPFLMERTTERPELFGFLFFALTLVIFFSAEKPDKKQLLAIPFILLLWINMHLSFIYGVFLLGVFFIKSFVLFLRKKCAKNDMIFYYGIVFASTIALFINPHGWRAIVYPFTMFANYGYRIIENQTVFFLLTRISNKLIPYFLIVAPIIVVLLTVIVAYMRRKKPAQNLSLVACRLSLFTIAFVFILLAFLALRNFPFFALGAIPALSIAIHCLFQQFRQKKLRRFMPLLVTCIIIVNLGFAGWLMLRPNFSLATEETYKQGTNFFLQNKLPGNIFNNFDIGGYLDYRLYPQYQTFVDNRPEAFPKKFFDIYIAAQNDPQTRQKVFAQYDINTIIFSINDVTPWAQEFLKQITQDSEWQTIYLDRAMIILVRKERI